MLTQRHKLPKTLKRSVQIVFCLCLCTLFGVAGFFIHQNRHTTSQSRSNRHLLQNPNDAFTESQLKSGAVVLHLIGIFYTFLAIAIVADEFFVPAIEIIVDKLHMSPDTAGATFMAAGGSAPELFSSFFGVFLTKNDVGFGTIVGSAVFNVLFVIGCCAIFTEGDLVLTWWPFARDSSYYCFGLLLLAAFFGIATPNEIYWYEALILFLLYFLYVFLMMRNERIHYWFMSKFVYSEEETKRKLSVVAPGDTDGDQGDTPPFVAQPSFADMPRAKQPIEFHVSLFDFLTRDEDITELAGIHMVARIKGNVEETFRAIDANGDGEIDKTELRTVLFRLGEAVSEEDVQQCFDTIDTNHDGRITAEEFFPWYHRSKLRMHTDIVRVFTRFDRNDDGQIDQSELKELLNAINREEPSAEDVQRSLQELDPNQTGQIAQEDFINWYQRSMFFEKTMQKRAAELKADEKEEEEEGISLAFPKGCVPRVNYIITMPIIILLVLTMKDVRKERNEKWFAWTFIMSIAWLGFYSWLMVWWATTFGDTVGIPPAVMGLTLLAAGTSVPDLLTSVIVARLGEADMAVSSSIGSNIFDILVGLPLPWLVRTLLDINKNGGKLRVGAEGLFVSVIVLLGMLLMVLFVIKWQKWRMTHNLGYMMFVLYFIFMAQDLMRVYIPRSR